MAPLEVNDVDAPGQPVAFTSDVMGQPIVDDRASRGTPQRRPGRDDDQWRGDDERILTRPEHGGDQQCEADPDGTDVRGGRSPAPGVAGHGAAAHIGGADSSAGGVGTDPSTSATTVSPEASLIHISGFTVMRWARAAGAVALTSSGVT